MTEAERALYGFVVKLNARRGQVEPADAEAVRSAGWPDEAVFDAIAVSSLFQFFNSWVDGNGVAHMSPEAYRASGKRLATGGY